MEGTSTARYPFFPESQCIGSSPKTHRFPKVGRYLPRISKGSARGTSASPDHATNRKKGGNICHFISCSYQNQQHHCSLLTRGKLSCCVGKVGFGLPKQPSPPHCPAAQPASQCHPTKHIRAAHTPLRDTNFHRTLALDPEHFIDSVRALPRHRVPDISPRWRPCTISKAGDGSSNLHSSQHPPSFSFSPFRCSSHVA